MRYLFGDYCLDTERYELHRGGAPIPLRPKVYQMLLYLLSHYDRVVLKEELLEHVWPGQAVGDAALHSYMKDIRKALGDGVNAQQLVRTIRGRGYRFIAPVEIQQPVLPDSPLPIVHAVTVEADAQSSPFLPRPATDLLRPDRSYAGGEYKLVSILCGALAEASSLASRLGPEPWYHLLQTVMGLTQEVLLYYGGTLDLATGDGFTAVFGAPMAQEDHARRAVLAALELRQRLQDDSALHTSLTGHVLRFGMGLHSGLVVIGDLLQGLQRQASVVGASLHVATRLQQQAAPGLILLSTSTYQQVRAEVEATPYDRLDIDGQPMAVYAVQGLLERQAGVAARGFRAQSPFVGRERELLLLQEHLAAAMAGQGQVVGVVGAPGMGKTRLVTEFYRYLPEDQIRVYVAQCLSYGQATPYLPVRDLLRQLCGLVEGEEPTAHTAAVQQRLQASGITAEDDIALLLDLLDLSVAPGSLARVSPEARQMRTFALLRYLVLEASQQQPRVLVVENLQWSDPTSEAWLASLVERLSEAALLLLGTYRPGYQPAWGAHAAVTQIALSSLRAPDSRRIVQAVRSTVSLTEAQLQIIVVQSGGNPFFLEELAWHAMEQSGQVTPGELPETVHAVLAARMDRLSPEAKKLLQTAAVIGIEIPFALLQSIAELPEGALQRGLSHLQAAEFLYETRLFPEPNYTFKHALTHEVAYGSLLQERRRALHACIVEVLEARAPEQLAEQVDRLAHHALRGGMWDKALAYCRQAGARAVTRSAYHEAVACFEQALDALAQLPERRDTLAQTIDLRIDMSAVLQPLGELTRMMDHLRTTLTLAERLDDPQRLGWIASQLCFHSMVMGEYDRALVAGERALALATTSGAFDAQVLAQTNLGLVYSAVGDFVQTLDISRRVVVLLTGERRYARAGPLGLLYGVISRSHVAWSLAEIGGFAEGTGVGEEAVQLAEAVEHPYSVAIALTWLGLLYCRQGRLQQAIPRLERGLAFCQTANFPIFFPLTASVLSTAYGLAGRLAEALPLLEQLLQRVASGARMFAHELMFTELSAACLLVGRVDEAQALAERLRDLSCTHSGHGHQAHALRLLGDVAMRRLPSHVEQAEGHYRQALALAEETGMRPLQAHCHRGLGALYAITGQHERSRTALPTAIEMYRAMDMTLWIPQVEAELAQPLWNAGITG